MAFKFEWPNFGADFLADARTTLENALNKGPKPPIIADRIVVEDLNMGTIVSLRRLDALTRSKKLTI